MPSTLRSLQLCGSLAFALLTQAQSPFSFRMVFTHPATDSAYAVEHCIRQVIKTRHRISLRVSASGP